MAIRKPLLATLLARILAFSMCAAPAGAGVAGAHTKPSPTSIAAPPPSEMLTEVADWVIASGDNRDRPFAVVDKVAAEVFVFDAHGHLKGAAPALVGLAIGDNSTPGVGDRELSDIAPEERTTPAGRFVAAYGPSAEGKEVLWVDYATAISMHEVINSNRAEDRPKRLASPTPDDNRITFGCINVPIPFYQKVVRPAFRGAGGVVYVLPETESLAQALPAFEPLRSETANLENQLGAGSSRSQGTAFQR